MKKLKTEIIIFFLLWLSIIFSLYLLNYKFDILFIFGMIGLSIATITYKKKYEISLSTLVVILFFSSLNLIKFSLAFGVNFGIISIPHFTLLIILAYKRRNKIIDLKEKWFAEDIEEVENRKIKKTEFFKNQFVNLSETELNRKLTEEKLTVEAKNAIIELLKLKKTSE